MSCPLPRIIKKRFFRRIIIDITQTRIIHSLFYSFNLFIFIKIFCILYFLNSIFNFDRLFLFIGNYWFY